MDDKISQRKIEKLGEKISYKNMERMNVLTRKCQEKKLK